MSETPSWLKSMEHGAIGESRARAFLLDRFWVLERSVDIHGADYLIQRRLTEKNFLDRVPPRLGIVQVKFIQDEATNVHIKQGYVLSEPGIPHEEFFLLVHTGREDEERQFLLSARDLASSCPLGAGEYEGLYKLTGKRLIKGGEFEIASKKRALDRIEHALKNADFFKNRTFIGTSNYLKLTPDQIEHEFLLPLENSYGDIQRVFYEEKKKLQRTLFDLEEVTEAMGRILRTTDPQEAFEIFESEVQIHIGNGGSGDHITMGCLAFRDEDFLSVVKDHKRRISKLKALGLTEAYFDLLSTIEKTVVKDVAELGAIGKSDVIRATVRYAPKTLKNASVTVKRAAGANAPAVKQSAPGHLIIYFRPWDWLEYEVRAGKKNRTEECGRDPARYQ